MLINKSLWSSLFLHVKKIVYIYNYFIFKSKAINEHGVHSPFVFDLLMNIIYNRNNYYWYKRIENVREQLLNSKKTICGIRTESIVCPKAIDKNNPEGNVVHDKKFKTVEKTVAQITKGSSKSAKYSQLMFRLVNHFQPPQIIEIGTSFGINTAYMAAANSKTEIITIEENPEIAEIARQNFKHLKLKNIVQKIGNIDDVLPGILVEYQNLNFVYFDENHCKQNALGYFYSCLEKADEKSVFVFADMYLSSEMKEAWNEIKNNNRVTVTLDLFFICIVFFRKEQVKQHFLIKY